MTRVNTGRDLSRDSAAQVLWQPAATRILALSDERDLGVAVAAALERGLDPHEERDFETASTRRAPLAGVLDRIVHVAAFARRRR